MKDETTIENSQYILKAIHELLDDRLPKRHVGEQGPERQCRECAASRQREYMKRKRVKVDATND